MKHLKIILFTTALVFSAMQATAQTADVAFTPYSIFGIGELSHLGTTYNANMAGIGVGDRTVNCINVLNPAAVTARETKSFMLDFGLENRNKYFQQNDAQAANNTFNMHHIVFSMPIYKSSAFKVGIMPYSNLGYKFQESEKRPEVIAEMGDVQYVHTGKGSIYQVTLGAGVTLWDRLSLGVDGLYYFGNVKHEIQTSFSTNTKYRYIETGNEDLISAFGVKFGLQYTQNFNAVKSLTIGATYSLPTKLKGYRTHYAYASTTSQIDTVTNDKYKFSVGTIPAEIAVGISFRNKEKFMIGFDYTYQDWTKANLEPVQGVDFAAVKSQNFRLGFEVTPNMYDVRYFFKRLTYRGGVYHDMTYMSLNGKQVAATGLTLGVGIPVFRYHNMINFGIDLGQKGSLKNNMVRERYFLFTLSFSMHDIWFIKPMYQ